MARIAQMHLQVSPAYSLGVHERNHNQVILDCNTPLEAMKIYNFLEIYYFLKVVDFQSPI